MNFTPINLKGSECSYCEACRDQRIDQFCPTHKEMVRDWGLDEMEKYFFSYGNVFANLI